MENGSYLLNGVHAHLQPQPVLFLPLWLFALRLIFFTHLTKSLVIKKCCTIRTDLSPHVNAPDAPFQTPLCERWGTSGVYYLNTMRLGTMHLGALFQASLCERNGDQDGLPSLINLHLYSLWVDF